MPKTVIHDHDGHVDDLLSCILLWLSPEIDLQAVGITNGDCYAPQIFEATQKIATLLDIDGPEIAIFGNLPVRARPNAGSDRNALQRALRERMERE